MRARVLGGICAWGVVVAMGTTAGAQGETFIPPEEEVKAEPAAEEGWDGLLKIGANIAFGSNRDVVGQQDGQTWTFGLDVDGALRLTRGKHDWRNTLIIQETFSRTPVLEEFVKSTDLLDISSVYYFLARPWVGPFVLAGMDAPLLPGYDYRPEDVDYTVTGPDGTTTTTTSDRLRLTDPFQILTLNQSLGAFFRPVREEQIELEFRAGFGAQEVFADGARAVNEVVEGTDRPEIVLIPLESYAQGGAELAMSVAGSIEEGKLTYKAWAHALMPLIYDAEGDPTVGELTNAEFGASLSFKLVEWASLDYRFKAVRQPQLIDEWQIQNSLLLSFNYLVVD